MERRALICIPLCYFKCSSCYTKVVSYSELKHLEIEISLEKLCVESMLHLNYLSRLETRACPQSNVWKWKDLGVMGIYSVWQAQVSVIHLLNSLYLELSSKLSHKSTCAHSIKSRAHCNARRYFPIHSNRNKKSAVQKSRSNQKILSWVRESRNLYPNLVAIMRHCMHVPKRRPCYHRIVGTKTKP